MFERLPNPAVCVVRAFTIAVLLAGLPAMAQQPQPVSQAAPAQPASAPKQKTITDGDPKPSIGANPKNDRLFGVIPNYTTVENTPADISRLTVEDKFRFAAEDALDPYAFPLAGLVAAIGQAQNQDPSWGQGASGFAKRFGASYADTAIGTFMTTAVFPSLLHEDPRYFRLGQGGFGHRTRYSVGRIFVVRTDSGGSRFNLSELLGNGAAAGISNLYHPADDRTFSGNLHTFGTQMAIDTLANVCKEFWPDIRHKLFSKTSQASAD